MIANVMLAVLLVAQDLILLAYTPVWYACAVPTMLCTVKRVYRVRLLGSSGAVLCCLKEWMG